MRIRSDLFRPAVLWALGSVLFFAQPASAARLLKVYIELDGNVIVHTFYEDGGRADAARVWRYLQDPPIMVNDDVTAVQADPDNPLHATLEGDLQIRIQHKTGVIAQARLSTLMLRRADEQTQQWFLPVAEVERTAGAAGLGPPSTPWRKVRLPAGLWPIVALLTLIVVGVLVATALFFSRRPREQGPE